MNKKNLCFWLVMGVSLSISSGIYAIGKAPSAIPLNATIEVLKLPSENRKLVIKEQSEKYYKNFIVLAFDEAQPMGTRWRALMAAAEARGADSTPDLLKAGEHKKWYMRNAAVVALAEVEFEQAEKLAQKLLKDKALVVRSAAVEVLRKNLSPSARELLWEELNQSYNFKNSQSLWIRHQIVEVLAQKPLDREVKSFTQLLSDRDVRVQLPAVRGLERLTGTKLGEGPIKQSTLVTMWKDFLHKENMGL
ncbi:MAG: HEAT repeat domain-containing protein [Bdellovibrio sp.]